MIPDSQPMAVPAAPVTLLDIFTRQIEMGGQLTLINERLNAIPDHENRIRVLEASKAKLYGAAVTLSVIGSALGTWVGIVLTHR
jgi:hypothetical protein